MPPVTCSPCICPGILDGFPVGVALISQVERDIEDPLLVVRAIHGRAAARKNETEI